MRLLIATRIGAEMKSIALFEFSNNSIILGECLAFLASGSDPTII